MAGGKQTALTQGSWRVCISQASRTSQEVRWPEWDENGSMSAALGAACSLGLAKGCWTGWVPEAGDTELAQEDRMNSSPDFHKL